MIGSLGRVWASVLLGIGMVLMMASMAPQAWAQGTWVIPDKAHALVPVFVAATDKGMPGFGKPQFFLGQGEHESCVSLKSKRCMDPTAELKSPREQGVGIPQLTRTFRPDGTVRFDTLANLKQAYPKQLAGLTWDNIKEKPELQITAQVLLFGENYKAFAAVKDNYERIAMASAGYNGGPRDVQRSRYMCGLAKNCDPNKWFLNTERHCVKSKEPLYGNRSACDINTAYPRDILHNRVPKYEALLAKLGYKVLAVGA